VNPGVVGSAPSLDPDLLVHLISHDDWVRHVDDGAQRDENDQNGDSQHGNHFSDSLRSALAHPLGNEARVVVRIHDHLEAKLEYPPDGQVRALVDGGHDQDGDLNSTRQNLSLSREVKQSARVLDFTILLHMSNVSKIQDALSAKDHLGLDQLPEIESFEHFRVVFSILVESRHPFIELVVTQVVVVLEGLGSIHEDNPNQRGTLIDKHGDSRDDAQIQLVDSHQQNDVRVQLDALRSDKYELFDLPICHHEGSFGLGGTFGVSSLISSFKLLLGFLIPILLLLPFFRPIFFVFLFLFLVILLLRALSVSLLIALGVGLLVSLLLLLTRLNGREYAEGTVEEAQSSHGNGKLQVERLDRSKVG